MTTDDENYDIEEILLMSLISIAPPMIRAALAQQLRERVSIKAGDAAAKLMDATTRMFPNREFMFEEIRKHLLEDLRGDTLKKTVDPNTSVLVDALKQLLGISGDVEVIGVPEGSVLGSQELPDRRFAEPTPDCTCRGCTYVREMQEKGIKIDSRTGEHVGPHHIN